MRGRFGKDCENLYQINQFFSNYFSIGPVKATVVKQLIFFTHQRNFWI